MAVTKEQVLAVLAKVASPGGTALTDARVLSDIVVSDGKVFFSLTVDAAAVKVWEPVRKAAEAAVRAIPGVQSALVALTAERAARGSVVVDMSTISPVATRSMAARLAEKGVEMLDAPVSGGDVGAINGTLSIMVGGKPEMFGRVKPLFDCMGKNIVHIGANGAGQVAKACNQIVAAVTLESVSEALTLARKHGVDAGKVREALLGGFAWSKVLEIHGRRNIERDFKPGFKAKLHQKDLRIVTETAAQLGIGLPQSALIAQHLNALVGMGCGDEDSAAVTKVIETLSGLKL